MPFRSARREAGWTGAGFQPVDFPGGGIAIAAKDEEIVKNCLIPLTLALGICGPACADEIRAASQRATGLPAPRAGSGLSAGAEWSPDGGSVVFSSTAGDLVPSPPGRGNLDVYLRRLASGSNVRVSVASDGSGGGNGRSSFAQFAGGSNRVVFGSSASNLVVGDTNGVEDVFLRDLETGSTTLLSAAPDGSPGNGASSSPLVTAGRWVLFDSLASNLVPGVTNGFSQVHLCDLSTGGIELAAMGQDGAVGTFGTWDGRISDDGRWITFRSPSTNLVADYQFDGTDLHVRDRVGGGVRQLAVGQLPGDRILSSDVKPRVRSHDLSPDGRFVAAVVGGVEVRIGGVLYADPVALWYDLATEEVRTVVPPGTASAVGAIRLADGGRRVFVDAIPSGETTARVMAWDEVHGLRSLEELALTPPALAEPCTNSRLVDVTSDGGTLLISSPQALGAVGWTGGVEGTLLHQWTVATGDVRVLTTGDGGTPVPWTGFPGAALNPDGTRGVFESAGEWLEGDSNRSPDVFLGPDGVGPAALVSLRDSSLPSSTAAGRSSLGARALSDDGRWVLFTSLARDLVEPAVPGEPIPQLFLRDMDQGEIRWVTRPAVEQVPVAGAIVGPVLTSDGARVFFSSVRGDLVAGDTNGVSDVFLYDRDSAELRALSMRSSGSGTAGGSTILVGVDGLGRRALLESEAPDLDSGGTSGSNVFLHDAEGGVTVRISTNATTPQGILLLEGVSRGGAISEDGRWAAFLRSTTSSRTGEVIVRDEGGQVFRVDPDATAVSMVVLAPDGAAVACVESVLGAPVRLRVRRLPDLGLVREIDLGSAGVLSLTFTSDGRRLLLSTAQPLVAADTNGLPDVYLVGVSDDTVDWVSSGRAAGVPGGSSDQPSMSRDGRVVAFRSTAPDVALGDAAEGSQVVVRDHVAGLIWRASAPVQPGLREPSARVVVSGDGRSAVFQSSATGLVVGDHNGSQDVFHVRLAPPADGDTDGDGLPDAWERWNFGTLAHAGDEDSDDDGVDNIGEYRARTHPADPSSRLELSTPVVLGDRVGLGWRAVPGVAYRVERADDLSGPWAPLGSVDPASGGWMVTGDDAGAGAVYRVRVPASDGE